MLMRKFEFLKINFSFIFQITLEKNNKDFIIKNGMRYWNHG
jgi:hypothetical protein